MSTMSKLKYSWILWGIIMFTVVGLLFIYGLGMQKIKKPYKKMEEKIIEDIKVHFEANYFYPEQGQRMKIDIKDFQEDGTLGEIIVENKDKKADKCDGYILVTNDPVVEFKTYLKCKNYTTYGYEKNAKND